MTNSRLALLAGLGTGLLASLLAACNPYDPDLGYEPFRCGASQPTCPRDYTCVVYNDGQALCEKTGSDRPDAGEDLGDDLGDDEDPQVTCNDDSLIEPNDATSNAYDTGIPFTGSSFSLAGMAICPSTDVDFFELEVQVASARIEVEVEYRPGLGQLIVDLLDRNSMVLATAQPLAGEPGTLHLVETSLPLGKLYVRVRSAAGVENNYDSIVITTTP